METGSRQPLVLREWQIYHTYASFFTNPLPPAQSVARNLVRFGVAESAVTSDGEVWWNTDEPANKPRRADVRHDQIEHGVVKLDLPYRRRYGSLNLPQGVRGYVAQGLSEWGWRRWAELFLFGDGPMPPEYVSAQIGACTLVARHPRPYALLLYPTLRVYATGVVVVEFRMLAPRQSVVLHEFVEHYLNAPMVEFRWALVPPGVAAWAPLAIPEAGILRWYRRPHTAFLRWYHQRAISQRVSVEATEDFSFQQVALSAAEDTSGLASAIKAAMPEALRAARDAMRQRARELGVPQELLEGSRDGIESQADRDLSRETGPRTRDAVTDGVGESGGLPDPGVLQTELIHAAEGAARSVARKVGRQVTEGTEHIPETFHSLALTLMRVAGLVAGGRPSGPRRGIGLALLGLGNTNNIGNHWTGRPHVHLIRFAGQSERASDNEARLAPAFGAIVARTVPEDLESCRRFLPRSSRPFDDFGAYLTQGLTLWVHSRRSVGAAEDGQEASDPNRDRLVHEHQVKASLLEYGYSLHRRIAERATDSRVSIEQLLNAERDLADFEWAVEDTGRFGEVRDLLAEGWNAFGVPVLRERIADVVRTRREIGANAKAVATARWTGFLAIVVGVLAVPTVVDIVLRPLWHRLNLPRPLNDDDYQLLLVGVAISGALMLLGLGYWWSRRRQALVRDRTGNTREGGDLASR